MNFDIALFIDIQTNSLKNISESSQYLKLVKKEYNYLKKKDIPIICTYMNWDTPYIGTNEELYPKTFSNVFTDYPNIEKQFVEKNVFIAGMYASNCIYNTAKYAFEELNSKLFSKKGLIADINPEKFFLDNKARVKVDVNAHDWLNKNIIYL